MRHAYPLMLDVTDRLCVIIGGGGVAVRKAKGLLAAGATRVRVVAASVREDMPEAVERIIGVYEPRHLDGAGLVFAATDVSEVNDAVVSDARRLGLLVNRADVDEDMPGNFVTPAQLNRGPVTLTVSTTGAPALAAMIRDALAQNFDPQWREMALAMQTLRPRIRDHANLPPDRRRAAFRDLATPEAIAFLAAGGTDALWRWLKSRYPELE